MIDMETFLGCMSYLWSCQLKVFSNYCTGKDINEVDFFQVRGCGDSSVG